MTFWSPLFRLAALSLLLSAAVDLVAVDLLGALWQDRATVQSELQGSCAQDDCFCCSGTVTPVLPPVVLALHVMITFTEQTVNVFAPSPSLPPHFRPPRA